MRKPLQTKENTSPLSESQLAQHENKGSQGGFPCALYPCNGFVFFVLMYSHVSVLIGANNHFSLSYFFFTCNESIALANGSDRNFNDHLLITA